MRQPLERIPQLVILTQALVKVTPLLHPDRPPLQMALTHLECLSETLAKKRKDSMCKHKVRQLDGYFTGLDKVSHLLVSVYFSFTYIFTTGLVRPCTEKTFTTGQFSWNIPVIICYIVRVPKMFQILSEGSVY